MPGNHDQRMFGVGLPTDRYVNALALPPVVVDDDLETVFLCFNSSEGGLLARGAISSTQLRQVATALDARELDHPEVRGYQKIALLHHHPFDISAHEPPIGRFSVRGREVVVGMDNADEFLDWCAARRVPIVLHGHKHNSRHVCDARPKLKPVLEVTAVGCGTSLGIDRDELSYNVITWDPKSGRWVAEFIASPTNGAGFQDKDVKLIALHPHPSGGN